MNSGNMKVDDIGKANENELALDHPPTIT